MTRTGVMSIVAPVGGSWDGVSMVSQPTMLHPAQSVSLKPMPELRMSCSSTYIAMAPFCWASPPLVVVRLIPSETSNTWKMMITPISPITIATISSIMLKPRANARFERVRMGSVVVGDRFDDGVLVRRETLRRFQRHSPEHGDRHLAAARRAPGDDDRRRVVRGIRQAGVHLREPRRQAHVAAPGVLVRVDVSLVVPDLREHLVHQEAGVAAHLRVGDVFDRDALHPDHGENPDREDEDRDQRLDQHHAALVPGAAHGVDSAHGQASVAGQARVSGAATLRSHSFVLPPGLMTILSGRVLAPGTRLLTSMHCSVSDPSGLLVVAPSAVKVTVVAPFGVVATTALGVPSKPERLWITGPGVGSLMFLSQLPDGSPSLTTHLIEVRLMPDPIGAFTQPALRSFTNWKLTFLLRATASARAT